MAKKGYGWENSGTEPRKPIKKKYLGYGDMTFVDYVLDDVQLKALKAWTNDPEFLWARMNAMTTDGFKVSFTFDAAHNAYLCTLMVTLDHSETKWHGYCMTQRGSEPLKAFKRALYVVEVICEGDLDLLAATKATREIDD